MDRRKFLETGGKLLAGTSAACGLPVLSSCGTSSADTTDSVTTRRWGMLIDLTRCSPDCDACVQACRRENNVAFYGDKRWDIYWIRKVNLSSKNPSRRVEKSVPLLCNHCDNPPCAQVCPVQATYKRDDGIVIVDQHRCIGCRYCMIACPYNARFFNFRENPDWPNPEYPKRSHGVAESCNFCAHLLEKGQAPACVTACHETGAGAMYFGDLDDAESEISQMISSRPVKRIREDWGTEPKVYYLGL